MFTVKSKSESGSFEFHYPNKQRLLEFLDSHFADEEGNSAERLEITTSPSGVGFYVFVEDSEGTICKLAYFRAETNAIADAIALESGFDLKSCSCERFEDRSLAELYIDRLCFEQDRK